MTNEEFLNFVNHQYKLRLDILDNSKKKRTAGTDDRFIQFRRMAELRCCTMKSAAADLMTKQFTDFLDMADESHAEYNDLDYFIELGADIQNYIDITLAIAIEEKESPR